MRKQKGPSGAVGTGGVNPAPTADNHTVRVAAEQLTMVPVDDLVPYVNNAKVHSAKQISQLRASLREFGFVTPVLIDFDNNIIAGHGRVEAARAEGMDEVPCVLVSSLTEAQRKAYILADNRLAEAASWDPELLELELQSLEDMDFDTAVIGFELEDLKEIHVGEYTRTAPGQRSGEDAEDAEEDEEESPEYQAFVDKFKPKKTTDDCYTPENVYQSVRDWAVRRYGLEGAEIIRPFWPGGDYQAETYPEGCVVIDNPPFSILSEICRWFEAQCVQYFLFAPTLSLYSVASGSCNYVPAGCQITYENGASVTTSFVTNLGEFKIETVPDLYEAVNLEERKNLAELHAELPSYVYPAHVVSASMGKLSRYGQTLRIMASDVAFIRSLDAQTAEGKGIFGGGFLLSDAAAAEKAAAEKAAAEKAAAEKAAAEKAAAEKAAAIKWELSERELAIIRSLGSD